MGGISKIIPLFIFISIYTLISSDVLAEISGLIKTIILDLAGMACMVLIYIALVCVKERVSFAGMVKRLLPTFIIALSTASSAAAFSVNLDTCENKLGIPKKAANFAVLLGQVYYMPSYVIAFTTVSLCMAEKYGVAITPIWLVMNVLVSGMLNMASAAIPGGALMCYTVLFSQLGIPAAAMSIDVILDFVITACDLTALQTELVLASDKLEMLDKNVLKRK